MGNCNFVFRLLNDHHFQNDVYEYMFMNNILICHKNIHQVLEHVCVVLQYAFRGIYYKSIMNSS